jgi:2',3'-cyclic-nucleotide 2'-phosphodiesterase
MIGDIVGRTGRSVVIERLKEIRSEHQIDFVVANIENAAAGFGIMPYMAEEFLSTGVDVMTSGNHIFDKRDIIDYIKDQPRLLRPANYPEDVAGRGLWTGRAKNGVEVAVINVQGRVFMAPSDCPFRAADRLISSLNGRVRVILVDHHAEATSEKIAMGWHLDGRVSAVVGTHTHVTTADERVLTDGTAYITDLGMTGPYDGVIGIDKAMIIDRFLYGLPKKFEAAERNTRLCAAIIDIEEQTGLARSIARLVVPYD